MRWVVWLYLVNTVFMLIVAVREVRRPAKALNWLTICLILPVVGFGLYLSTSNPMRIRRERLTSPGDKAATSSESFNRSASVVAKALSHLAVHAIRTGQVQVLTNGLQTYEQLMQSIQNAKRTIDVEYFTYRDDHIGRRITDLLIDRSAAGIRVRFVRDGLGSRRFPRTEIMRMADAGIECRTFFPVRFPWILANWNYRDHCKIVIIDKKEAFTGGINVGDEYTGLKPDVGFWRDTHVRILGEVADDLGALFDAHWGLASPERAMARNHRSVAPLAKATLSGLSTELSAELATMNGTGADTDELQAAYVQIFEGNPGIPTPIVREVFFTCLTQATQTIDVTTPYFIPDADIIMAMKTAVARGVRVRLLVPRRFDRSTSVVGPASRTYYGELLEAGVQIYLYTKGVLHAKVMTIDGEIAEIGAANYDMRSFRLDYEDCAVIYSVNVARDLTEQFERDLTDSVPLCMEDVKRRSRLQRMLDQGARLLSPLL